MNEEADMILSMTKEAMQASIEHLDKELLHIRAGKSQSTYARWFVG
jgi:ribosome recycling factor